MHDAIAKHGEELNRCNQRGGRMLSVFDLLSAGTLDKKAKHYLADPEYIAACRDFLKKMPPSVRTIEDTRRHVVEFLQGRR